VQSDSLLPDSSTTVADDGIVFISGVCAFVDRTDRTVETWIRSGKFPAADGDINSRRFWLRSTLQRWKVSALNGSFRRTREPFAPTDAL
jgi:hypothetical protein